MSDAIAYTTPFTIEQAAQVIAEALEGPADAQIVGDSWTQTADLRRSVLDGDYDLVAVARALAEAGLLAPAPLTEVQAEAWDEGYRAGSQDMSDLRAGELTFQTITTNPYRQEATR